MVARSCERLMSESGLLCQGDAPRAAAAKSCADRNECRAAAGGGDAGAVAVS